MRPHDHNKLYVQLESARDMTVNHGRINHQMRKQSYGPTSLKPIHEAQNSILKHEAHNSTGKYETHKQSGSHGTETTKRTELQNKTKRLESHDQILRKESQNTILKQEQNNPVEIQEKFDAIQELDPHTRTQIQDIRDIPLNQLALPYSPQKNLQGHKKFPEIETAVEDDNPVVHWKEEDNIDKASNSSTLEVPSEKEGEETVNVNVQDQIRLLEKR